MDSPRYRLEGSPLGDFELDEAALEEKAAELDKEDPGWEDEKDDEGKDDPFEHLDRLQEQFAQRQRTTDNDDDKGRGIYSLSLARTSGSPLLNDLDRDDTEPNGNRLSPLGMESLFQQTWDGPYAQPPNPVSPSPSTNAYSTSGFAFAASLQTPQADAISDSGLTIDVATSVSFHPPIRPAVGQLALVRDRDEAEDADKEDKDQDMDVIPPPPPHESSVVSLLRQPQTPPLAPSSAIRHPSPRITSPPSAPSPAPASPGLTAGRPIHSASPNPELAKHAIERPIHELPRTAAQPPNEFGLAASGPYEADEDEDDSSGEEEAHDVSTHRRAKRRRVTTTRNRFIEDEAEVDDDDEDFGEEDADYVREAQEFIEESGDESVGPERTSRNHQQLDLRRRVIDNRDAERIAADLKARHQLQQAGSYIGDDEDLPQSFLVPSVEDPKLWQVHIETGRERQLVYSLMHKALRLESECKPALKIFSAFSRDTLSGLLYVEADTRAAVEEALDGFPGVYLYKGVNLVPIDEMPALLKLTKKRVELKPQSWVRVKRGRYRGDLAKVLEVSDNGEVVTCKLIPRVDLSPADDDVDGKRKRKAGALSGKAGVRPPPKYFSSEEVIKVYGRRSIVKKSHCVIFHDDVYSEGFLEKALPISRLETEGVIPTMDELEAFAGPASTKKDQPAEDYRALQEQARLLSASALQTGDIVEVTADQNQGAIGTVIGIAQGIVILRRTTGEAAGSMLTVLGEFVRKTFRQGEHVKVVAGKHLDETGLVLEVRGEHVTFLADLSREEVTTFAKDIRVAEEVGSGLNAIGQYAVHDLVQLDKETIGVIIRIERQRIDVLDTRSQVHSVSPEHIANTCVASYSITQYDQDGQVIRKGDAVVETLDEQRSGVVLAIRRGAVFLYNRDIESNHGVFVTSARKLVSSASKRARLQTDLMRLNPDLAKHVPASSGIKLQAPSYRDPLVFTPVVVVKGIHKSRIGLITDINGEVCRVELQATNETITIKKDGLRRKDPVTGAISDLPVILESSRGVPCRRPSSEMPSERSPSIVNPYANDGGRTPAYPVGRTPNPLGTSGGATPGNVWGCDVGTPGHAIGGRTPAYNVVASAARTPGAIVVHGGRTPAFSGSLVGARTPARIGKGERTPAYSAFAETGGRTPSYVLVTAAAGGERTPAYGALAGSWTPLPASSNGQEWGAETPMGAGSTGYANVETPGTMAAPHTPDDYNSIPTPGPSKISVASASTPGMDIDDWD